MDDLDRWTRVLPLGAGAFGEVHLAWDHMDGRWVALKRFTGQDELGLLRMVIESRIRVSHPHLVHTVAFHLVDDRAWLITELARGGSLRTLMTRTGVLPWGWVAEAVDQILSALTALHATGVVHRDLKPANLLLRSHGPTRPHLLVGDFGIATWRTVSMTGIGAAIGTPGYLAPEYLDGRAPSPATDLFAVGVLAAELLTGSRLVHRSNASPTMPSNWHDTLPVPAETPRALAMVLQRMAAPDPRHRYPDCEQARQALLSAVPPTARNNLTTVVPPDLLAALPPGWTVEGPDQPTTALSVAAAQPTSRTQPTPPAQPTPPTQVTPPAQPTPRGQVTPSTQVIPPPHPKEPISQHGSATEHAPATEPDASSSGASTNAPSLVGVPIDGGPTALVLANEASVEPGNSAPPPTPPALPQASGSSTHPPSDSATPPATSPTGSSTHPPSDSATSPATSPTGSATPLTTSPTGSSTHPPTGSATSPATPPKGSTKVAAAPRKVRPRRNVKQALVLVFLVFLAASAGTLWWTVTHRTTPGHPTAIGGTTDEQTEAPSQWVPTIVSPCSTVEVAREQTTESGDKIRCQRTPTLEPPQHWVEEPPTGFPKSDPGGPFPDESCEADGDTAYSPVGDHLTCENESWRITA